MRAKLAWPWVVLTLGTLGILVLVNFHFPQRQMQSRILEKRLSIQFPEGVVWEFFKNQSGLQAECTFATLRLTVQQLDLLMRTGPLAHVKFTESNALNNLNITISGWEPAKCKKCRSGTLQLNENESAIIMLCFDDPKYARIFIYIMSV